MGQHQPCCQKLNPAISITAVNSTDRIPPSWKHNDNPMNAKKEKDENTGKNLTFEQAFTRLDETVLSLEAGELPLAEATQLYESGMKLAQVCNEMLAAAELKITQIQTAYDEQMRLPTGRPSESED